MRERGFPGSLVEANRAGMIAATLNWLKDTFPGRGVAIPERQGIPLKMQD